MAETANRDWSSGAPKWAAVIVLGGAAIAGLAWSVGRDSQPWRSPKPATALVMPASAIEPARLASVAGPGAALPSQATPPSVQAAAATPSDVGVARPTDLPTAPAIKKLINVNSASQAELELLPGIGPAKAKLILEYRSKRGPFKRIEDLDAVKGIGPKTLERLRPLVTIE